MIITIITLPEPPCCKRPARALSSVPRARRARATKAPPRPKQQNGKGGSGTEK